MLILLPASDSLRIQRTLCISRARCGGYQRLDPRIEEEEVNLLDEEEESVVSDDRSTSANNERMIHSSSNE